MSSYTLPKFVVLGAYYQGGLNYLRSTQVDGVPKEGYIKHSTHDYASPEAKFEVEPATEPGNEGLVHIRSCFTNKYWSRLNDHDQWIVAGAKEKQEKHQDLYTCTLFKPVKTNDEGRVQLIHVQRGHYVAVNRSGDSNDSSLIAGIKSGDDVFIVTDWSQLVILPKLITLKADNDKYLYAWETKEPGTTDCCLMFVGTDVTQKRVVYEVFTAANRVVEPGQVHFKSKHNDKFWRSLMGYITAEYTDDEIKEGNYTHHQGIRPIRIGNGGDRMIINLLGPFNKQYASRNNSRNNSNGYTPEGLCLIDYTCTNPPGKPTDPNTKEAQFTVLEPVRSRTVTAKYRFEDARIYNEGKPSDLTHTEVVNDTPETNTYDVTLKHKTAKTTTWNNNFTVKASAHAEMKAGIPYIAEGKVESTAEVSDTLEFGKSKTKEEETSITVHVTVPPHSTRNAILTATEGACDVPFTYVQTDEYYDGHVESHNLSDGVFTGINSYNFHARIEVPTDP